MDAPRTTKDFAKRLRRRMTLPEVLLWRQLRGRALAGLQFRKQHPVGPYVLDFYCHALKLAVEVDGAAHGFVPERDERRDAWLAERGVRTLRLRAAAILQCPDGAALMIQEFARQDAPPQGSSREAGEGVERQGPWAVTPSGLRPPPPAGEDLTAATARPRTPLR